MAMTAMLVIHSDYARCDITALYNFSRLHGISTECGHRHSFIIFELPTVLNETPVNTLTWSSAVVLKLFEPRPPLGNLINFAPPLRKYKKDIQQNKYLFTNNVNGKDASVSAKPDLTINMDCWLIVLCCSILSGTLGQKLENCDPDECRLQLSWGSKTSNIKPVGEVVGRPGKSGPQGLQGLPGPMGPKGSQGDNCDCGGIADMKQRLDALSTPKCPQTKFMFSTKKQVTDWIRVKKPFQGFTELTVCVWIARNDKKTPASGPLLSYAVSSQANEFLLYLSGGKLIVHLKGKAKDTFLSITSRSHVCVVVSRTEGFATVFRNGELVAKLVFSNRMPIVGGGAFVIGQEQDQLFGGFVAGESFHGILENFKMWYKVIGKTDIKSMYNDRCFCPAGYSISLTPDQIQFEGMVRTLPVEQC